MEIGLYDFAEVYPDPRTGERVTAEQRLRDLIEEAQLADQVGLDVYGLGEHHRADFAVSAPAVVLAAIAARTQRIRLSSAVTVLSRPTRSACFRTSPRSISSRPDARRSWPAAGSFVESFPLFGYDLDDYDELFAEKMELLLRSATGKVHLVRRFRPALPDQGVYPRPVQEQLPIWIAVGGNPQSAVRAGVLGPLAIAIIGGQPARFVALAELYRDAARRAGGARSASTPHLRRRHTSGPVTSSIRGMPR